MHTDTLQVQSVSSGRGRGGNSRSVGGMELDEGGEKGQEDGGVLVDGVRGGGGGGGDVVAVNKGEAMEWGGLEATGMLSTDVTDAIDATPLLLL